MEVDRIWEELPKSELLKLIGTVLFGDDQLLLAVYKHNIQCTILIIQLQRDGHKWKQEE
jgi:hypothetical protein